MKCKQGVLDKNIRGEGGGGEEEGREGSRIKSSKDGKYLTLSLTGMWFRSVSKLGQLSCECEYI